MADEHATMDVNEQAPAASLETTDRGLFDFMKKKDGDEKPQAEQKVASEFDHKVQVSEPEVTRMDDHEEKKKHGSLLEKLHRSDSSSSSSSDEEGDDEEKKKRKKEKKEKKGLKEQIMEKLPGQKNEDDTTVPIEKYEETKPHHVQDVAYSEPIHHPVAPAHPQEDQEKKGLMEKIKDNLPAGKKAEDQHHGSAATATSPVATEAGAEGEKKGFLEKIKDKIPGFHSKDAEEKKESP